MFLFYNHELHRIKIGITANVDKRKRSIERASGLSLSCVYSKQLDGFEAVLLEKLYHDHFCRERICGEWFKAEPVLDYLRQLAWKEK